MALNISFTDPWVIFFAALIVVVAAIIALTVAERKLNKRLSSKKEGESFFIKKLVALKKKEMHPREFLVALDALTRDFLSQKFGVDRDEKYSELVAIFRERKNEGAAQLCERIQEAFYTGEDLEQERLDFLGRNLEFLINEERKMEGIEQRIKKEVEGKKEAKEEMKQQDVDKKIVQYLAEGRKRGFSLNILRQKLSEAGFKGGEVEAAIEFMNLNGGEKQGEEAEGEESVEEEEEGLTEEISRPPKIKTSDREPRKHKNIRSLDDLERIKGKLGGRVGDEGTLD